MDDRRRSEIVVRQVREPCRTLVVEVRPDGRRGDGSNLAMEYADGGVEGMWRARDGQVPMGHMGDAWDVAYASLFLASDESKYVTGIELVVDGGITLKY